MSIVGTRPPTLDEWNKYELHHRARLAIKPGIVCLSEVYDSMLMWSHYAQNHRFGLMFILARR